MLISFTTKITFKIANLRRKPSSVILIVILGTFGMPETIKSSLVQVLTEIAVEC